MVHGKRGGGGGGGGRRKDEIVGLIDDKSTLGAFLSSNFQHKLSSADHLDIKNHPLPALAGSLPTLHGGLPGVVARDDSEWADRRTSCVYTLITLEEATQG